MPKSLRLVGDGSYNAPCVGSSAGKRVLNGSGAIAAVGLRTEVATDRNVQARRAKQPRPSGLAAVRCLPHDSLTRKRSKWWPPTARGATEALPCRAPRASIGIMGDNETNLERTSKVDAHNVGCLRMTARPGCSEQACAGVLLANLRIPDVAALRVHGVTDRPS